MTSDNETYNEVLQESALWVAKTPPFYDDDPKPVRQHASPPSDRDISLAFALMIDVADRINGCAQYRCDAPTLTGRAIQAALCVAVAHQMKMRSITIAETNAAGIVIEAVAKFLAEKAPKTTHSHAALRKMSSLLLLGGSLGGRSSYDVAKTLNCDPSALRKRLKTDLSAIEVKFGSFCKNHKALRKKWHLPQTAIPSCYNSDNKDCGSLSPETKAATAFGACIDPDFDAGSDLTDTLARVLFDD